VSADPEIRAYSPGDEDAILIAYREAVAAGNSFPPSEPPTRERMREVWVEDKSAVLVAELDGEFAGCT
jgi:hypothetical protein